MYTKESKAVSYILRHGAEKLGIPISKEGWVRVAAVIAEVRKSYPAFSQAILEQIVREDEKGRYSFNPAMDEIRANQGHSLDKVEIKFQKKIPPVTLYHGTTAEGFLGIQKTGIQRMKRHHVHLIDVIDSIHSVGMRRGSEVIIEIDTRDMVKDGIEFFQSENGVWLTNYVDIKYFRDIIRRR